MIHFCSCQAPCPCMFNAGDMDGCELTVAYHFTDGGYVGKDLSGQSAVVVYGPARPRKNGKRDVDQRVTLYLPKGATKKQREAVRFALIEHNMNL